MEKMKLICNVGVNAGKEQFYPKWLGQILLDDGRALKELPVEELKPKMKAKPRRKRSPR